MTLYEWMVKDSPGDFDNAEHAKDFFLGCLKEFNENPIHLGDCVKLPFSCSMCLVAETIDRYGQWCRANRSEALGRFSKLKSEKSNPNNPIEEKS
jgi:hypothetical protein